MSLTNTPEVYVNDVRIAEHQIDAEVQYHPSESRREAMVKATEALIIEELFRQRALALEMIDDKQNCDDATIDALIAREVALPQADEQEVKRYFEQYRQHFATSPLVEAKHILIAADPAVLEERAKAKEVASQLITQLQQTPDAWDVLCAAHSHCPSKETHGNLGQLSSGQSVKEFERALFKAQAGLITYPVESRYGFHVAFIERKIDGKPLPFEHVREDITDYLNEKVRHKGIAQYIQILADEANITGFNFVSNESILMQ